MKLSRFVPNCIMILFLAGTSLSAPLAIAPQTPLRAETAAAEATPASAAAASPSPAQESHTGAFAVVDVGQRIRENLVTDQSTLRLISADFGSVK